MAKIRIVSDGTPGGTRVYDEAGKILFATKVEWSVDVNNLARATITFDDVEIDAVGTRTPKPGKREINLLESDVSI